MPVEMRRRLRAVGNAHAGRSADLNEGEKQEETIEIVGIAPVTRHQLFEFEEPAGSNLPAIRARIPKRRFFFCSLPFACFRK